MARQHAASGASQRHTKPVTVQHTQCTKHTCSSRSTYSVFCTAAASSPKCLAWANHDAISLRASSCKGDEVVNMCAATYLMRHDDDRLSLTLHLADDRLQALHQIKVALTTGVPGATNSNSTTARSETALGQCNCVSVWCTWVRACYMVASADVLVRYKLHCCPWVALSHLYLSLSFLRASNSAGYFSAICSNQHAAGATTPVST